MTLPSVSAKSSWSNSLVARQISRKVLSALLMAEVNIIFSYPLLVRPRGRAVLVMHVDDSDCSSSVLRGDGFKILAQADLSR